MITFEELREKLPWLNLDGTEWHQHPNGDGWVQNSARVDASCHVEGIVYGNAQVYGDAQVYDDARVYGDARVCGYAQVYGDARVCGDAQVYGDARVCGDAWTFSPLQIQGTVHFVNTCSHTHIQIGCHSHTVSEWQEHYKAIGKSNSYTPDQIAEYAMIIEFAANWLKQKFGNKQVSVKRDKLGRFTR